MWTPGHEIHMCVALVSAGVTVHDLHLLSE